MSLRMRSSLVSSGFESSRTGFSSGSARKGIDSASRSSLEDLVPDVGFTSAPEEGFMCLISRWRFLTKESANSAPFSAKTR